jgi:signal transduction histidine kinase
MSCLISNALKYCYSARKPVISVVEKNHNKFLPIDFTDKGLGIDLEVQNKENSETDQFLASIG